MKKVNLHYGVENDGELYILPACMMAVSRDRYTDDLERVTCKFCLRHLEKLWAAAEVETDENSK